ncbi:MAG: hypothetical protein MK135_11460 [Polyangiaceae bacterium]|nr:hypothetical protein [Polyangiaceae bacterium]
MSDLLNMKPYSQRNDARFLAEMQALTRHHQQGCLPYGAMIAGREFPSIEELPFVHVGMFKNIALKTESDHITHQRNLLSSATSSGVSSVISLDKTSSELQSKSVIRILKDFVGEERRPLLILDSAASLRSRGKVSARIAAALGLQPLSTEIHFLLKDIHDPSTMQWETLLKVLENHDDILVYGFTWVLWLAWGQAKIPNNVKAALKGKNIQFVHSGGWKKLEASKVHFDSFHAALLENLGNASQVIDYYGLVEQVGIIYPLCSHGSRHVPLWADVIVRDPWTLKPIHDGPGQLQLMNVLAHGAPYHSVLTEDMGRLLQGECGCGRKGKRFELLGRIPKAETRGCSNV